MFGVPINLWMVPEPVTLDAVLSAGLQILFTVLLGFTAVVFVALIPMAMWNRRSTPMSKTLASVGSTAAPARDAYRNAA